MQTKAKNKGGLIILLSFVVAMLMDVMPLPDSIMPFKPEWVALVLIYWVMALPSRVGIFSAWTLGLFVDVLDGTLFGIHALSLALVAFLIELIFHRLRLFPRWKQALNVAVIIGINLLVVKTLSALVQPVYVGLGYWIPLLTSALFWPWIFILLRDVRRKYC